MLPLEGVRVLDFTRLLAGPFCTMKLGDMGAFVIKIEHYISGDDSRSLGALYSNKESSYFNALNRNKKSITLNLKEREAISIVHRLLEDSDVLIENFRPGVMKSLGLDYESLSIQYPKLLYLSISGYGQTSERSKDPSYDLLVQGETGLMKMMNHQGKPSRIGISLCDIFTGQVAIEAILLSLIRRSKTGKGVYIDLSLFDCSLSLLIFHSLMMTDLNQDVLQQDNRHSSIYPYNVFSTKDGLLNLSILNNRQWKQFCKFVSREEWSEDPRFDTNEHRFQHQEQLEKELILIFQEKTTKEWLSLNDQVRLPIGNIVHPREALFSDLSRERNMICMNDSMTSQILGNPIHLEDQELRYRDPPCLGEHTYEILFNIGYNISEINELKKKNII